MHVNTQQCKTKPKQTVSTRIAHHQAMAEVQGRAVVRAHEVIGALWLRRSVAQSKGAWDK